MDTKMSFKNWLPLLGLTYAAFIFNTSEFIPIGLLSDIAEDFSTTEAHAGMLISVYAWIVMILSLPLMLLVSKIELRKLMLCTIVMFMVCQLLSSFFDHLFHAYGLPNRGGLYTRYLLVDCLSACRQYRA